MIPLRTGLALLTCLFAAALHAGPTIDATTPPAAPQPLPFAAGGSSPSGHTLAVNNRFLLRDGQPWFPVMGEFHFARYPEAEWDAELQKMKAGGIDIVGTYVFWIFHEEKPGEFNWSGQRNVRKFIEACGRNGLQVWLRVGPWCHGEVRNGGFPDWLVAAGPTRENAPGYLAAVERFFGQIGQQVHGQFWQDGGPIVGVQLENEYHPSKNGEAHMTKLLELAQAAGLVAPFYTATGWDRAVIPASPFLPVFGGYTEQFWSDRLGDLPPNQNFFFTNIRAEDNVGYDLKPKDRAYHERSAPYPFFTAEMGGGMAFSYHRRGVVEAADTTAPALIKIGSGISLLGYYMYHGGTNPDAGGPMHESFTGWNAYNELESKSYDFQAPLGETGQVRESYRTMKLLHLFLRDFGDAVAPMTAYFPSETPQSLDDSKTPRVAFRSDGTTGFVFTNNHQRYHPLPARPDFQVTVKLGAGNVTLPRQPVTLPSGTYTHWPVNFPLGAGTLRSASAQLVCRLGDVFVFTETPGVPAEFVFALPDGTGLHAPSARVSAVDGTRVVTDLRPGRNVAISLRGAAGKSTDLVLLPYADALDLYKLVVAGQPRLLLTHAAVAATADTATFQSYDSADLRFAVYPALSANPTPRESATTGLFTEYAIATAPQPAAFAIVRKTKDAAPAEPVKVNPNPKRAVALEPSDADFERAAVWTIEVPEQSAADLLRIRYVGDVARLYAGNRLLTDNFYRGTPIEFGLWRLSAAERQAGLTLKVLPLRRDAPVYIPREARPKFDAKDEALSLDRVELVPSYRATFP